MQALQMLLDRLNSGNIPINSEMITRSSTEGATNVHRSTTGAPVQGVSQASDVTCTCIIKLLLIFCVCFFFLSHKFDQIQGPPAHNIYRLFCVMLFAS